MPRASAYDRDMTDEKPAPEGEPLASDDAATPPAPVPPDEYDALIEAQANDPYYDVRGVPSYDAVRGRIEQRIAAATGHEVLDEDNDAEAEFQRRKDELKQAGADRLAQLRRELGLDE